MGFLVSGSLRRVRWETRVGVLLGYEGCGAVFDGYADGEDDGEGEVEPEPEGTAGGGLDAVGAREEVGFVSGFGRESGGWYSIT